MRSYLRDHRAKNREHYREKGRRLYAANADSRRASSRRWREANREATREAARRYYREHRDERLAYAQRYRDENRDAIRAAAQEHYRRNPALYRARARERSMAETAEAVAYMAELLEQPCAYCGSRDRIEVDHVIPFARGGKTVPENLVAACLPCNRSKGSKTPEEWLGVSV